jgi:hypothetical protein
MISKLERDPKRGGKGDFYIAPREWGCDFVTNMDDLVNPLVEPEFQPGVFMQGWGLEIHRTHLPLLRGKPGVDEELLRLSGYKSSALDRVRREEDLGIKLRPHQHVAIDFISRRRGVLLGDQMRLRKTTTSLACHDPKRGRLVVIAPLSVRDVWLRWMRTIWPDIEPRCVTGKTYITGMFEHPIVFCHYEIAAAHQSAACKIGTLILDEAHLLSNPRAQRTKAVLYWASKAEQVIPLTGTPLWNQPPGLWSLLSAVNPGAWGSHFQFSQRYGNPQMTEHGTRYFGATHADELQARLSETMIARSWPDVRGDLPPSEWRIDVVPLPDEGRDRIDIAAANMRDSMGDPDAGIRTHNHYKQAVGRYKVNRSAELVLHVLDELREPVVVWVWHKRVAAAIAERLQLFNHTAKIVTGDDDEADRVLAMGEWRVSERPLAIILTMAVGQVGIDLSHARHCIFAELEFTPATMAQAAFRTFSEDRPMIGTFVVVDHEADRKMAAALLQKMETGDEIGVAAAEGPLDIVGHAFGQTPAEAHGDLSRLSQAILSVQFDINDVE